MAKKKETKKTGKKDKELQKGLERLQKWLEESRKMEIEKATENRYTSLRDPLTRQLITGKPIGRRWILLPDGRVWHPEYGYGRLLSTSQGIMIEPEQPKPIKGALPSPYRGGEIVSKGQGKYLGPDPRQVRQEIRLSRPALPPPQQDVRGGKVLYKQPSSVGGEGEIVGEGRGKYLGPDPRQVRQEIRLSRPALPPPQDVIEGKIIKTPQDVIEGKIIKMEQQLTQQSTQGQSFWQRLKTNLKNTKIPRFGWVGAGLNALLLGITVYEWLKNRDEEQQPQQKPEHTNQKIYEEIYSVLKTMPQQSSQKPKLSLPAKSKQTQQTQTGPQQSSQKPKLSLPAKSKQTQQTQTEQQTIKQAPQTTEQQQEQTSQLQPENLIQENQNLLAQASQSLQQGNENAYLNALERLVSNHEKFIENVISQQNELVSKMTEILSKPLPDTPKFGASELEQNLRTITQSLIMIASLFAPSDRLPFYVGMVNGMMQAWREQDMDNFERQLTEYKLNLEKDLRERDMQLKAMALGMEQLGRNIGFADRSFQLRWELVQSQWRAELEKERKAVELQKEIAKRVFDLEKILLQHKLRLIEIEQKGEKQKELTQLRASLRPPKTGSGNKPPKLPRINTEILNRALYQANQYGLTGDKEGMINLLNTLQNSYNITDYERQLLIQEYQKANTQKRK